MSDLFSLIVVIEKQHVLSSWSEVYADGTAIPSADGVLCGFELSVGRSDIAQQRQQRLRRFDIGEGADTAPHLIVDNVDLPVSILELKGDQHTHGRGPRYKNHITSLEALRCVINFRENFVAYENRLRVIFFAAFDRFEDSFLHSWVDFYLAQKRRQAFSIRQKFRSCCASCTREWNEYDLIHSVSKRRFRWKYLHKKLAHSRCPRWPIIIPQFLEKLRITPVAITDGYGECLR